MKFKILSLIVLLTLAGCSQQSADEYITAAKTKIAQSKSSEAIIDLKNAIKAEPDNAVARFLLGSTYLEAGEAISAEKEFRAAINKGYELSDALPLLIRALYLQGKNEQIIAEMEKNPKITPDAEIVILIYQALAYFQLDQAEDGRFAVERANDLSSESEYSQLGRAYSALSINRTDEAMALVNTLLINKPDFSEAALLRGKLAIIVKDYTTAVDSFEKFAELLPKAPQARLLLANAYIKNEQFEKAEKIIDALLVELKTNPIVNHLKGVVRFRFEDYPNAKLYSELALQNGLKSGLSNIIAGISAYQLGVYEQAYQNLVSVESELYVNHPARRVLVATQLKLGYGLEANKSLQNIIGLTGDDIELLSAVSYQLLLEGENDKAGAVLDISQNFDITNPKHMAWQGMLKLSLNDLGGVEDLLEALDKDPNLKQAKGALVTAYFQNEQFEQALELSKVWQEEDPNNPASYNVAAYSLIRLGRKSEGEEKFKQALALDSDNVAALLYFADDAYLEKDVQKSSKYLNQILSKHPDYMPALIRSYLLFKEQGQVDKGLATLSAAFQKHQDILRYRLLYARGLFDNERFDDVILLLKDIEPKSNTLGYYWVALGDSYVNLKRLDEANKLFSLWVQLQPKSKVSHIRRINTLELSLDYSGALKAVEKALVNFGDEVDFKVIYAHLLLSNNQIDKAQEQIKNLPENIKNSVEVQGLQGKIYLSQDKDAQALPLLKALYDKLPTPSNAGFVASVYIKLNQQEVLTEFLNKHIQRYPNDLYSLNLLANIYVKSEPLNAIKIYLQVIEIAPQYTSALNNLAWLYLQENDFDNAAVYAEQALKITPNNARIIDTLGSIKLAQGNNDEALKLFYNAYKLEPNSAAIQLNYAKGLLSIQDKDGAKEVLQQIQTNNIEINLERDKLLESI